METESKKKPETESKKKSRVKHPDRVTLEPEHLEKLDKWISQVIASRQGVRLARKDFVGWLIDNQPEDLSQGEIKKLADHFYDEEWFLTGALREIKEAKFRGESLTLDEIRKRDEVNKPQKKSRPPTKNNIEGTADVGGLIFEGIGEKAPTLPRSHK